MFVCTWFYIIYITVSYTILFILYKSHYFLLNFLISKSLITIWPYHTIFCPQHGRNIYCTCSIILQPVTLDIGMCKFAAESPFPFVSISPYTFTRTLASWRVPRCARRRSGRVAIARDFPPRKKSNSNVQIEIPTSFLPLGGTLVGRPVALHRTLHLHIHYTYTYLYIYMCVCVYILYIFSVYVL